jgi:hypothetical protein
MTSTDDEPGLPRLSVSYARALAPWKRSASSTTQVPATQSMVLGWRPDRERVATYRAVVGSTAEVPLALPQVPVMAMTVDLVSRWSFPMRALGMVHMGSVVEVLGDLPLDAGWDLRTWATPGRHVRSGMEFDVVGEVSIDGTPRWRSRAVYLSRSRSASGAEVSTVPGIAAQGPWDAEQVMPVAEGTGRAFARVSGDINPMHLHQVPARAFGFHRAIAHGWWTTGRVAAMLAVDECAPGRTFEVVFRRPVELPSAPTLCSRGLADGVEFAVMRTDPAATADPGRALLVAGRITG